jgi:hypothetical protein
MEWPIDAYIPITFFDPALRSRGSVPGWSGKCSWGDPHNADAKYSGQWKGRPWGICSEYLEGFVQYAIRERRSS